ncbi:MAG: division/cell wall cluster transcriptional repressor MraZ [Proteobacteria bacterium]|nr:division/cell wall cluster transcriptional repressor MraZ [Pseudomonadota bacterium]MBU1610802.1 division/cell wall cluster transcriptional repressor MraZ [Pseudomonadota bacterium]
MIFRGHVDRSLDPKGRLMLPPEYREYFHSQHPEGCLVLTLHRGRIIGITPQQWDAWEAKLLEPRTVSDALQSAIDIYLSSYEMVKLDKHGRIQIPPRLRKSGKLNKDVVVLGSGRHFAVMDVRAYDRMLEQQHADVSQEMSDQGLVPSF